MARNRYGRHICGCYYFTGTSQQRNYLPQVKLEAHTTILSTASRTVVKQRFINASKEGLEEVKYAFPLFDGVSVVDFVCKVGDRTIYGLVRERAEARKTYEEAKDRGEKAALLEQLPDAADVFITSVSNIPKSSFVEVSITYIQELKHDAEVDGIRLTIPTSISPRYGSYPGKLMDETTVSDAEGISLTIDVSMAEGIPIKKIISPSHPIEVHLGALSASTVDEEPSISKASATLALGTAELEKDFVLQVVAKDIGVPQAFLETHSNLPNQRALMATLVPKFNLKSQKPEIVFIADRSGSMHRNIPTLISALKVFLKSIPMGCMFNICSFGSRHSFLWTKSQVYGQETLEEAIRHVSNFQADYGGTETLNAVKACVEARHKEMPTELMLLTDGDIWAQQQIFTYVDEQTKSDDIRVFPIGIGGRVSSALIEGVARAGHGFAQMVTNNEKLDSKIVRMLKGALTPHVKDYRLEIKYEDNTVESIADSLRFHLQLDDDHNSEITSATSGENTKPISLYDPDVKDDHPKDNEPSDIFADLPKLDRPKILQTPHDIPSLFPFNRTCVYLKPKSVLLKGTSSQGPLELEIPIEVRADPDQMIHQLAARKATQELEEGRGWVVDAVTAKEKTSETILAKDKYPVKLSLLQKREAVRLGVEFQVGGKYCSFVAIEANEAEIVKKRNNVINCSVVKSSGESISDWQIIDDLPDSVYPDNLESSGTSRSLSPKRTSEAIEGFSARRTLPPGTTSEQRFVSSKPYPKPFGQFISGGALPTKQPARRALPSIRPATTEATLLGPPPTRRRGRRLAPPPGPTAEEVPLSSAPSTGGVNAPPKRKGAGSLAPKKKSRRPADADAIEFESEKDQQEEIELDGDLGSGVFGGSENIDYSNEGGDAQEAGRLLRSASSEREEKVTLKYDNLRYVDLKADARFVDQSPTTNGEQQGTDKGALLESIIAHQTFEGSWSFDDVLHEKMGIKPNVTRKAVDSLLVSSKQTLDRKQSELVLSTAIVVRFLENKMAENEETWELIVEKAKEWLEGSVEEEVLKAVWKAADNIVTGVA
ncbi:hypothetical protein N0V90_008543 [Kalmusia sp. IMI 367209]|nr:hypothetical protein N0V90_008543 [Kalmusia sp. IMI 367209]